MQRLTGPAFATASLAVTLVLGTGCAPSNGSGMVQVSPIEGANTGTFYIDPYEAHINLGYAVSKAGEFPATGLDAAAAKAACAKSGKRLCKPEEFFVACLGPKIRAFSFQDTVDGIDQVCDVPLPAPSPTPTPTAALAEAGNLTPQEEGTTRTQALATGSLAGCKTDGLDVYDLIGGVSEWVDNTSAGTAQTAVAFGVSYATSPSSLTAAVTYCAGYTVDEDGNPLAITTLSPSVGFRCCADSPETDLFAPNFPYVGN